ncbi:RNA-guided endonuclease InsQ/TnpB family protein [Azotobacter sp. CWF10]
MEKKARARAIHARIANRRKDALHKFSRQLVNRYGEIHVGDMSSAKLAKTRMAKSVLDASWGQLKVMLDYKCAHAGIVFKVVDERYTTQACSNCGTLSDSRPKGIAGLGMREWTCSECGVTHDRDVNAARSILAAGHGRPVVGIPALLGGEDVKSGFDYHCKLMKHKCLALGVSPLFQACHRTPRPSPDKLRRIRTGCGLAAPWHTSCLNHSQTCSCALPRKSKNHKNQENLHAVCPSRQ